MLLIKIKQKYRATHQPVSLIVDEGRRKSGTSIGSKIFYDWSFQFDGVYESSESEPLLQIADFIAYCINRSTHLGVKKKRTELDNWFLNLVGGMGINCNDFQCKILRADFTVSDFDNLHILDRDEKGL